MAVGGRRPAPAPTQPRPRGPIDGESKLARKSAIVEALQKIHSDRAVQTYNELVQKVESDLQHLWNNHKGTIDDLARAVQKLCAVNHISWTKVHHTRTRGKDKADAVTAPPRKQPASAGCLALDSDHWSAPVAQAPVKVTNTDTNETYYRTSVSLHNAAEGAALLATLARQTAPLAVVVLGPKDDRFPGVHMKVPMLHRLPNQTAPQPTHLDATVYQFGDTEVNCTQNSMSVELDPASRVIWLRITIWEDEATAVNPDMSDLFTKQFAGDTHKRATPKPKGAKDKATAQQAAQKRYMEAKANPKKQALDADLHQAVDFIRATLFEHIQFAEPCKGLYRNGTKPGQRTISATFGIKPSDAMCILAASGQNGITFDIPLAKGASAPEDGLTNLDFVFYNDPLPSFADAYADSKRLNALGVHRRPAYAGGYRLALRVPPQSAIGNAVALELRGTSAALANTKYRITGIHPQVATKGQILTALRAIQWSAEVFHIGWDDATKSNFALLRTESPPPTTTLIVGSYSQPWAIQLQAPNTNTNVDPDPTLPSTATVVGPQDILAVEPPAAIAPKSEAAQAQAPNKPAWMASFAFAKWKATPSGNGGSAAAAPPVAKVAKLEYDPPRSYRDVAMEPARAVDEYGGLADYSEDDAEFLAIPRPVVMSSPSPRSLVTTIADSPETGRGSSSATGMTDAQDRRLRVLEDKFNVVTTTTDHLLSAQAEMTDSIAALHSQSAIFGKAQDATAGTLAFLAENVAKLVAGLPAAQAVGTAAVSAPSPDAVVPSAATAAPPLAPIPAGPPATTAGSDRSTPY